MKLLFVLLAASAIAPMIATAQIPQGEGKAVVEKRCHSCHGPEEYQGRTLDRDGWERVIESMINHGAEGTDAEFDAIILYLSRNFGIKVNVNKAAAKQIQSSLDMKSDIAEAVIQYRDKNGAFKTIDDLKKVPGVDVKEIDARTKLIEF